MHIRLAALFAVLAGPALAEVPNVATDIPPVHGLVARVMDGLGAPDLVVPPAASAHSHDLRPSEAAVLDSADIVVWIGEDLSPWLTDAVETLASDANVITLLEVEGTELLPFREIEGFGAQDHHGDEDHDHDHGHAHAHGAVDPHAWLDPVNAQAWLDVIAEALAAADPGNADRYRANAEAGRDEIERAVASVAADLADADDLAYVVFHDAYQYFEERFGLSPRGAVTLGDAAEPGPARIAEIQKQFASEGINCLLIEPQSPGRLVTLVTEGTAVTHVAIDPVGAAIPLGPDHYRALLASLSGSFQACR